MVSDAAQASAWYQRAFGAREQARVTLPGGKVLTVVLQVGDSELHVASEFPQAAVLSPASIGGTATVLQIQTGDAGALWQRTLDAGAEVCHELADQFWGERHGQLTDPFGHRWNIAKHLRDLTPEEIAAAAAQAFGGWDQSAPRIKAGADHLVRRGSSGTAGKAKLSADRWQCALR